MYHNIILAIFILGNFSFSNAALNPLRVFGSNQQRPSSSSSSTSSDSTPTPSSVRVVKNYGFNYEGYSQRNQKLMNSTVTDQLHDLLLQNAVLKEEVFQLKQTARESRKAVSQLRRECSDVTAAAESEQQRLARRLVLEKAALEDAIRTQLEQEHTKIMGEMKRTMQQEMESIIFEMKTKHEQEVEMLKSEITTLQIANETNANLVASLEKKLRDKEAELAATQERHAEVRDHPAVVAAVSVWPLF